MFFPSTSGITVGFKSCKGWKQKQTDGGINRWKMLQAQTVFELYLQHIGDVGRILRVFGHQVQVSRSMALKKKNPHTHSLSPFHTLYSLWWITRTFWDLIEEQYCGWGRLLCEVTTDNSRHDGEMKREGDAWKRRNLKTPPRVEWSQKTKQKSMFHFSPLFGFIFRAWPFTAGEGGEKWGAARRRGGKGKRKK